ncbi:hypothetical protein [Thiothrix caldifontis]|uniref:hypothetical protein n=1 Tax=Thiothrix caldifontis TaxID=525918 RepID=UPI001114DF77|nr:hypothetical protein [Thiothrix caldifontis]
MTKVISLNHIFSPSDNDGWRLESVVLEKAINDRSYYSIGILENSEERLGLVLGYSNIFYQRKKFTLHRSFYLSSNYKRLPAVMPVPMAGIRYHLTPKVDLVAQATPVPDPKDAYVIFMTGVNIDF